MIKVTEHYKVFFLEQKHNKSFFKASFFVARKQISTMASRSVRPPPVPGQPRSSYFNGRAATGTQVRAYAQAAAASTWSGAAYGKAEVGISTAEMAVLINATMFRQRVKNGEFVGKAAQNAARDALIAQLNAIDSRVAGIRSGRGRHRPLAYVPYFNSKGALQVPNEFKIRQGTQTRTSSLGIAYTRGAGHRLMPIFGRKHMAILGFVTRAIRGSKGKLDWSAGSMRAYASRTSTKQRVSKKAIAYYMSAGGKRVAITSKSRSRLAQLLVNTQGAAFGGAIPFQWGPARGAGFDAPIPNARAVADGERLRTVQSRTGPRYAIAKAMSTGGRSAARIVGLSAANRSALGMAPRTSRRGGVAVAGPAFIDNGPIVGTIDIDMPGSSNDFSVGTSGPRNLRRRRNDFEASDAVLMAM
jgi:hypothetical protein